jgi:hypothetical protein
MKQALIAWLFLPGLLCMDVVDSLRGDGGVVQPDDMQRDFRTWLSSESLGNVEMPNSGGCSGPYRAKNRILFAVQVSEVW